MQSCRSIPNCSAKFFHQNSGRLQYLESPLMLFGTVAAEIIQYGHKYLQKGSFLQKTASHHLSVSNGFLSILNRIGVVEGVLTFISGASTIKLSASLVDEELPNPDVEEEKIRDRLFYQGVWDMFGGSALAILSLCQRPDLGFAIINIMDAILHLLEISNYDIDAEDKSWNCIDFCMKTVEAMGWWSLSLFSTNQIGLAVGCFCLACAFLYKVFEPDNAIRTLISDVSQASPCYIQEEDDADGPPVFEVRLRK